MNKFIPNYKDKELPEGSDIKSVVREAARQRWEKHGYEDSVQNWIESQNLVITKLPNVRPFIYYESDLNHELEVRAHLISERYAGLNLSSEQCWGIASEEVARSLLGYR